MNEPRLKLVIIGKSAVGKTSICCRYAHGKFYDPHTPTIGTCFFMKRVCLEEGSAKVLIWDIMTPTERTYELSLSGTRGVLLVYDVSAPVSYDETQRWLVWCHERMQTLCPVAIVGNKVDLVGTTMNRVPTKMGQEYARRVSEAMNIPTLFKETSAKTGENIDILFREFTRMILSYDEGRILDNK